MTSRYALISWHVEMNFLGDDKWIWDVNQQQITRKTIRICLRVTTKLNNQHHSDNAIIVVNKLEKSDVMQLAPKFR